MVAFNTTCNATLDDLRILPTSEKQIIGTLTFHDFALILGGACTAFAIVMSFFLIFMHAIHYTKPREQKHIIRILFMVPIYAAASWLCIRYYWHFIYFSVISDCYEAFAISSFFALLCHYVAPDLHEQKQYFRDMRPIRNWFWPLTWFQRCCGGRNGQMKGPWRIPKSGLTWFNIIWIGIYQYCFIRVAATITAVVTQYFGKYCESSDSPVFSHVWILVSESVSVTIAMYCVIQFYLQMRNALAEQKPFLKVLAIKLVIFLSFWQSTLISLGTSTLNLVHPNDVLAYPDIKFVIPSLLLCGEMACFSVLHLWAFPYRPYTKDAPQTFYPVADPNSPIPPRENEHGPPSGGFLGIMAILDAANIWDVAKAFARGLRWLFIGVHKRHDDPSYENNAKNLDSVSLEHFSMGKIGGANDYDGSGNGPETGYDGYRSQHLRSKNSTDHLPIARQFRSSTFNARNGVGGAAGRQTLPTVYGDDAASFDGESAGLIDNAQPNPGGRPRPSDVSGDGSYRDQRRPYASEAQQQQQRYIGQAYGGESGYEVPGQHRIPGQQQERWNEGPSQTQAHMHAAMYGQPQQQQQGYGAPQGRYDGR